MLVLSRKRLDTSGLAWLGGTSLLFVTVAIPLQLSNEWITIGWSLLALALIGLWRRVDHAGLKYVGLGLFAVVAARLVLNVEVLDYHARSSWRILNWLAYTYLVPAGAMIGATALLRGREESRLRTWEPRHDGQPITGTLIGSGAVVIVFAWLNLAIVDWFSLGDAIELAFERLPARDLSMSIGWAVYGVALLLVGMWRRSVGLRRASLALLLGPAPRSSCTIYRT